MSTGCFALSPQPGAWRKRAPHAYTPPDMTDGRPSRGRGDEIETRLNELRRQHGALQEAILRAKAAQRRLSAEIRTLEAHLALAKDGDVGLVTKLQAGTLGDAVAARLRAAGEPQRIIDLVHALQDVGKLLRSDWAYSTVSKTLARDPRFRQTQGRRGYWELR